VVKSPTMVERLEKIEGERSNPYSTVDYYGIRQDRDPLSYLDFINDLKSVVDKYEQEFPDQFIELGHACSQFWQKSLIKPAKYVKDFMPWILPDVWNDSSEETKVVLAMMIRLRIESDEYPWFGQERISEFERTNNLPKIVPDKYMDFYREMIETRLKDPNYLETHPINPFSTPESTILNFAQIISSLGSNYKRPKIVHSSNFTEIFGLSCVDLRKISERNKWGLTVKEIVLLAEQVASNGHVSKK